MKEDRTYSLKMHLDDTNFEIQGASCGCPAGRGPKASCKHVAALGYALHDFRKLRTHPDFKSITAAFKHGINLDKRSPSHYLLQNYGQERKSYCHHQSIV
uniref:SWIM-type domain-containing protein n=1 Tax=Amphimedon queenslandica TaxID=400682 RepID=A0A1X7VDB6_AMPQE